MPGTDTCEAPRLRARTAATQRLRRAAARSRHRLDDLCRPRGLAECARRRDRLCRRDRGSARDPPICGIVASSPERPAALVRPAVHRPDPARRLVPSATPAPQRCPSTLGNVTLPRAPVPPHDLVSVARAALRAGGASTRPGRARGSARERGTPAHGTPGRPARLVGAGPDDRTLTASATLQGPISAAPRTSRSPIEDLLASVHPDDRLRMQAAVRATVADRHRLCDRVS